MVFLSVVTFSYEIITSYGSSKKEHVTGLALSSLGFFFMGEKKIRNKCESLQATSRATVFQLSCASESPRDLVKMQSLIP